jgi:hypothetical protein
MARRILLIVSIIATIIFFSNFLWAYNGDVHIQLNESAANFSQLNTTLITNLNMPNGVETELKKGRKAISIRKWLSYGGEAEDFGQFGKIDLPRTRASNHFHDPLKTWNEAGLDNPWITWIYYSNYWQSPVSIILWGFNPGQQDFTENKTGDWSWGKARENYYAYFTGKDFSGETIAAGEDEREAKLVDCFRAVGQVMHLLEDMSVPLHTRNDTHILPLFGKGRWTYETYTAKNRELLDYVPNQPGNYPSPDLLNDPQPASGYNDLVPLTGLFDRNQYNQGDTSPASDASIGLAEYSNANFLTNDTLWEYPHPALEETNYDESVWLTPETIDAEDGKQDNRIYFGKETGEPIDHLMAAGYWYRYLLRGDKPELKYAFIVDEECFAEYASKLIPRAVGYSATLLDYFFRGTMDVREIKMQGDGYRISGLDFEVKNTTLMADGSTVEPFGIGSLNLAYRYTLPGYTEPVFGLASGIYDVDDLLDPINDDFVSVSISFPEDGYIPPNAINVTFTLVFRGRLGNEDDAVVAKVFQKPSWIAYSYRPDGWPNPSHIYTVSPDRSDRSKITHDDWFLGYFFSPDWGPHNMSLAFENGYDDCTGIIGCNRTPRDIIVVDTASGNIINRLNINDESHAYPIHSLAHPSFSPDGSRLAAAAIGLGTDESDFYAVVVFDVQTGSWNYINGYEYWDRGLTQASLSSVSWSPLGDKIAYAIYDDGNSEGMNIHAISPNGNDDVQLTFGDSINSDPSWSSDGEQIVFISNRDGGEYLDIWIMDKIGENMNRIINCSSSDCASPSFSPDGSKIVFSQGMTVYTADSNGDKDTITLLEEYAELPSWSH